MTRGLDLLDLMVRWPDALLGRWAEPRRQNWRRYDGLRLRVGRNSENLFDLRHHSERCGFALRLVFFRGFLDFLVDLELPGLEQKFLLFQAVRQKSSQQGLCR